MSLAFQTKNQAIYEVLRKRIMEGTLKPGQRLVMREVAKEFGLSDIPVREAVRRLESDGFVMFTPHLGAMINEINEHEFIETSLIRIELESLATRLAVPHITDDDIEFLTHKNQEMKKALEKKQYEKFSSINRAFHSKVYNAAPYPYLNRLINSLWERVERTQFAFAYIPERTAVSVLEHDQIIDALKNKDVRRSEKLIKGQKSRTVAALEEYLRKRHSENHELRPEERGS